MNIGIIVLNLEGVIYFHIFKYSIATAICIALIVALIRHKGKFFDLNEIRDEKWRKAALNHEIIVKAICIAVTAFLVYAVISLVPPVIRDIPFMIRGEYLTAEGTVLHNALGGAAKRVQDREFWIIDDNTGEELHLVTLDTGLKEGEYVKVTYLPNSGLATINYRDDGSSIDSSD